MELLPETEELIYQKITRTGCVSTKRVSLSDIEAVDTETEKTKYSADLIFERSMKSALDLSMVFRVKSTGELLMFDREGVWHEEGLQHELMP